MEFMLVTLHFLLMFCYPTYTFIVAYEIMLVRTSVEPPENF